MKDLAMQMGKLPSSLAMHNRADSLDARLAEMERELASNPLERNLGFYDFKKHTIWHQETLVLHSIGDLWNERIQADLNSDDEAELESLEGSDMEQDNPDEMKTDATVLKSACQEKKRLRQDQTKETKRRQNEQNQTTMRKRQQHRSSKHDETRTHKNPRARCF
jgi:hypothetical protein